MAAKAPFPQREQDARLVYDLIRAERILRKVTRSAGSAVTDRATVEKTMEAAIDEVIEADTNAQLVAAAGRIERRARQLLAVDELPEAGARVQELRERVRLRAEAHRGRQKATAAR